MNLDEALADKAIATLDLPAKVRLLTGASSFDLAAEPSIGLGAIRTSDGPSGVRGPVFTGGRVACLLPNATLLAQHWDPAVAAQVGSLLAEEAVAQDVQVVLGPTINLHRTPLSGRLFEQLSEDPLLTGRLAAAYVRGLQDNGIGATPKHYLANETETERKTVSALIDESTLHEIYLLPFEIVVEDARPWTIMASYNRVNGTPATEHGALLDGILKGEWGFDGLVMSDWYAVGSTVESASVGLDLTMPGPEGPWGAALVEAVRAGRVPEATIDEHVRRILRLAARVGTFGTPAPRPAFEVHAPDSPARRSTLRDLAAGGMTVLVNRDRTLPIGPATTLAVIGRHATETVAQGAGSAQVRPPHVVSVADGIVGAWGADQVTVVDGVEVRHDPQAPSTDMLRDPVTGRSGMRVTTRDADGVPIESRYVDWTEVAVEPGGWLDGAARIELTAELARGAGVPERLQVGVRGVGSWSFGAPGHQEETTLHPVDDIGSGVLRLPSRAVDLDLPAGARLTATTPACTGSRIIGFVARPATATPAAAITAAREAARSADVAVVVVGLTQEQEAEEIDKITLALPGAQDALVAAVAGVARRTVVVVNAATPVLMPWIDRVDAVLWAGLPGQEAGAAVAAALSGEIEPAGRLVTTFPRRDGDGPAWDTEPVDGELVYAEGTGLGYRGWREEPLFWFGHGLGYTEWTYGAAEAVVDRSLLSVRVGLTNSGPRAGREIVQVYWRPDGEPVRLVGWSIVDLAPGESAPVEVEVDPRVLRRYRTGGWEPIPIGGEVMIARGLGDVRARLALHGQ